jgi:hypothetical protein
MRRALQVVSSRPSSGLGSRIELITGALTIFVCHRFATGMFSLRVLRDRDIDSGERHRCDCPVGCIFIGFQFHFVPSFCGGRFGGKLA